MDFKTWLLKQAEPDPITSDKRNDVISDLAHDAKGDKDFPAGGATAAKDVDHIFPIRLGGCDDLLNLVICCKSCNSKKHAKHPLVWRPSTIFLENNQDILRYLYAKYPGMQHDY